MSKEHYIEPGKTYQKKSNTFFSLGRPLTLENLSQGVVDT